jgi:hypothetical protein
MKQESPLDKPPLVLGSPGKMSLEDQEKLLDLYNQTGILFVDAINETKTMIEQLKQLREDLHQTVELVGLVKYYTVAIEQARVSTYLACQWVEQLLESVGGDVPVLEEAYIPRGWDDNTDLFNIDYLIKRVKGLVDVAKTIDTIDWSGIKVRLDTREKSIARTQAYTNLVEALFLLQITKAVIQKELEQEAKENLGAKIQSGEIPVESVRMVSIEDECHSKPDLSEILKANSDKLELLDKQIEEELGNEEPQMSERHTTTLPSIDWDKVEPRSMIEEGRPLQIENNIRTYQEQQEQEANTAPAAHTGEAIVGAKEEEITTETTTERERKRKVQKGDQKSE